MCPMYEYRCPQCQGVFEEIRSMAKGRFAQCPNCHRRAYRIVSLSTFKMANPFTKDGEGFTSVKYPVKEADIRNKYSVPKGVSV